MRVYLLPLAAWALLSATAHCGAPSESQPAEQLFTLDVSGSEIEIDDEWFKGCFHNAFEGEAIPDGEGRLKAGKQGIRHTKGELTGAGTAHASMTLEFTLEAAPSGPVTLVVRGLDDSSEEPNPLSVAVNGRILADSLRFPDNQSVAQGLNERYLIGWKEESLVIPKGVLRPGLNTISIANTRSCFDSQEWNYATIDWIRLKFPAEAKLRLQRSGEAPVLYYGLKEGVEVNAWPAVNLDNRICLIENAPLQMTFFATMPEEKPLGNGGPLGGGKGKLTREVVLQLETDGDFSLLSAAGEEIEPARNSGRRLYSIPLARLAGFETPHPAQGVTLFLRGGQPFESRELKAWFTVDGVPYRERVYPLRNIALKPLADRDRLSFDLGIWGGQIPSADPARQEYIAAARSSGFDQLFTGNDQETNTALKKAGFKVFPRYGWFGHQFKISGDLSRYAAVDPSGKPMPKDFCPLAILEKKDDPEIGKFFARAAEMATQSDIDGICVDYETAPVWCYCDRCLAKFHDETGLPQPERAQVAPGGPLAEAYRGYGRRRNRDLLAQVKAVIRKENPHLQYHALASASDIPSYWYDGRTQARHSVRELATFADAVYASCYFYELPGGLKSVLPIIRAVKGYAREANRAVGAYVIAPVATTISEFPRYRGTSMKPDYTRLLIQNAGLGGAAGVLLFRGDCFDGETFLACREALEDLLAARPYLESGIDRSHEVTLAPRPPENRVFRTEVAQHLLSRLMWRPALEYEYDAIELLKEIDGRDRLLAVFNYSATPLTFDLKIRGLFDSAYTLADFRSGREIRRASRLDLETGKVDLVVPARSCRMIRIAAEPSSQPHHP